MAYDGADFIRMRNKRRSEKKAAKSYCARCGQPIENSGICPCLNQITAFSVDNRPSCYVCGEAMDKQDNGSYRCDCRTVTLTQNLAPMCQSCGQPTSPILDFFVCTPCARTCDANGERITVSNQLPPEPNMPKLDELLQIATRFFPAPLQRPMQITSMSESGWFHDKWKESAPKPTTKEPVVETFEAKPRKIILE